MITTAPLDLAQQVRQILIVDDHPLVVDGLRLALQQRRPDARLSHVRTLEAALTWLSTFPFPDLVLLDLGLPDIRGPRAVRTLTGAFPELNVVVLSAADSLFDIQSALESGARGFISKGTDSSRVLRQIDEALAGGRPLPPGFDEAANAESGLPAITPRQRDVLALLARGYPNKKICQTLGLTEDTVKTHLKALFQTLDVHNRTECVAVAVQLGLIDPLTSMDRSP